MGFGIPRWITAPGHVRIRLRKRYHPIISTGTHVAANLSLTPKKSAYAVKDDWLPKFAQHFYST